MKYYDKINRRLVLFEKKATSSFWDNHWDNNDIKKKFNLNKKTFVTRTTNKYLPVGAKIIEGGCGLGDKVHALSSLSYDAYGIDYARRTIKRIKGLYPNLKISFGDVRNIPFPNEYFDGYWSLGVIEHFYNGYAKILEEMNRVLKTHGYLFITFPYMSPLRKLKTKLRQYDQLDLNRLKTDNFYQFMLNREMVISDIEKTGFKLIKSTPLDAVKGLKDEISLLKPTLQKIYDSNSLISKLISRAMSISFKHLSGHAVLLIFNKQ